MRYSTLKIEDLPHYTYDDYVQWEGRWEIINGIPYAMVPAPGRKHQRLSVKIAAQLEISVKQVRAVLKIAQQPVSLHTPIGSEEDSQLGDFIEDPGERSPAEVAIGVNLMDQTAAVLRSLTPREEEVVRMRFGIGNGSECTLEEVGKLFSVTRERIRQIECKALRKLRHPSRSEKLKPFRSNSEE